MVAAKLNQASPCGSYLHGKLTLEQCACTCAGPGLSFDFTADIVLSLMVLALKGDTPLHQAGSLKTCRSFTCPEPTLSSMSWHFSQQYDRNERDAFDCPTQPEMAAQRSLLRDPLKLRFLQEGHDR